ncbi:MAG: FecR domain-containing protein [Clostridium sp.]|nr:FecR domain-containing protein [Bacteroides sp.]MCM1198673.1 FecR domain-containing protein [Clostridium sp.]
MKYTETRQKNRMEQELLFRYFRGDTTCTEEEQILTWLESSLENRREFDRAHLLFDGMALYAPLPPAAAQAASLAGPVKIPFRRKALRWTAGIAAGIAIALTAGYIGSTISGNSSADLMSTVSSTGQQMLLTLPDGTSVQLNSGSSLKYPQTFSSRKRVVELTGEAMFDVAANPDKPFIVQTFVSDIQVLGTKFNVVADQQHNIFSTTLLRGKVRVASRIDPQEALVMLPNDVVTLVDGRLQKSRTEDFSDLCWTKGNIHIKKMPFDEMMAVFERSFNVKIVIERETLPEINVLSGQVRISDGVENALHTLQQVSDFTYGRNPKTNVITIR